MDPNMNGSPWFTEATYPSQQGGYGGGNMGSGGAPLSGSGRGGYPASGPGSNRGMPVNRMPMGSTGSMGSMRMSAVPAPVPTGTIGSGSGAQFQDPDEEDYDNEPPLLEELGVNFEQIWLKTQSVLLPTKQINEHILDDADLAGPIVYCFLFGVCLLFAAKVHFGYIYGFGVLSCLFLYLLMNLLSPERSIDVYRVCSVLGYCLLPIIGLAAINIFISVKGLGPIGFGLAMLAIVWSTHTASRFFEKALYMAEQRYLVVYPVGLVYSCFVMIAVF